MISFAHLYILILIPASSGYAADPAHRGRSPSKASTFAGETTAFQYPPAGAIETASDTNFPGIDVVGFEGPTPSSFGSLFLSSLSLTNQTLLILDPVGLRDTKCSW
jgi:hypothetical protein